ncbi:thymidine phosphorylase [Candidatus Fermentibacteria bacterium]|nr:MAG: thymidine phosphorylase [Candidatus Fermentibacteria bacterium]PIE52921.1 MAG: thymidine phosphorylase [Candidatus Fermentibacteria bacterium]
MVMITDLLRAKRDGRAIPSEQLYQLASGIANGSVSDYQASAFLMAAYINGLNSEETLALTEAMRDSGETVSWEPSLSPLADKHSTGGVGDKLSLVLAPMAASIGIRVPMISGRGLGHTGGTLDKLESIPGFNVNLSMEQFREQVDSLGVCMIGQTDSLAPADRKLYALRDATSTVTSIPLICASILSKKLAENPDILVFDVKCGSGAFMTELTEATELAELLVRTSQLSGKKASALITSMNVPLGFTAGNALEVQESIDIMRNRGPADATELTVRLVSQMAEHAGIPESEQLCYENLASGKVFDLFSRMVEAQGGDLEAFESLPQAPVIIDVRADRTGYWYGPDALTVGREVRALGGGRFRIEDTVDPLVGWAQEISCGSPVENGTVLGLVHASDLEAGKLAAARIAESFTWDRLSEPLVLSEVH